MKRSINNAVSDVSRDEREGRNTPKSVFGKTPNRKPPSALHWIASGVVPVMIYYGLKILSPGYFLVATGVAKTKRCRSSLAAKATTEP